MREIAERSVRVGLRIQVQRFERDRHLLRDGVRLQKKFTAFGLRALLRYVSLRFHSPVLRVVLSSQCCDLAVWKNTVVLISSGRQRSRRSTGKIGFYGYSRLDIISSTSVLRICLCLRRLRSTEDVECAGR